MPSVDHLTQRLAAIGESLAQSGKAHALLGLGSVGIERERLDEYSDLDFFVIAKQGFKHEFINDLSWLTRIADAGFHFQNTADGHKFLYQDGIFCEFAVFEANELSDIPYAKGQVVWAESGFDAACVEPVNKAGIYHRSEDVEWIKGELLTNLYVGLCRFQRGEKLSGFKFVQSFALDRVVDLFHMQQEGLPGLVDPYMPDRRIEQRSTDVQALLSVFCQGYDKTPVSALAQLTWLEQHYGANPVIASEIRRLAG